MHFSGGPKNSRGINRQRKLKRKWRQKSGLFSIFFRNTRCRRNEFTQVMPMVLIGTNASESAKSNGTVIGPQWPQLQPRIFSQKVFKNFIFLPALGHVTSLLRYRHFHHEFITIVTWTVHGDV